MDSVKNSLAFEIFRKRDGEETMLIAQYGPISFKAILYGIKLLLSWSSYRRFWL